MKSIIPYLVSFALGIAATGGWHQFYGEDKPVTKAKNSKQAHNRITASSPGIVPGHNLQPDQSQARLSEISLEEIRAIIREEIHLAGQNQSGKSDPENQPAEAAGIHAAASAARETSDSVSIEQADAFDDSLALIEDSRSTGVWDGNMRDQFRNLLGKVNPDQRQELMLSIIRAVNNGEIKPQMDGPFLW